MRNTSTAVTGHQTWRGDGDHLALGFFPELGMMTMPTEQNSGGRFGYCERNQQLNVLSIDVEAGISYRGVIDHETEVTRAAYIGSHLVATSSTKVTTHSLSSPTDIVGTAQLNDVGILSFAELPTKKIDPVVVALDESGSAPLGESFINLWALGATQEIDGQADSFC